MSIYGDREPSGLVTIFAAMAIVAALTAMAGCAVADIARILERM